jgi:hypothetical protein
MHYTTNGNILNEYIARVLTNGCFSLKEEVRLGYGTVSRDDNNNT